jgi:hypothetical protein
LERGVKLTGPWSNSALGDFISAKN